MWAAILVVALVVPQAAETVAAIQIHGNTATADEEVRRLADVRVGMPLTPTTIDEVRARLEATKRFQHVQVLKRFASIADPSQIILVLIVDDGPVKIERTGDPDRPTRVVRRRSLDLMILPILRYEDGYGATYGARLARANVAGAGSRVSFPLTWGGDKRAAAEFDKTISAGPIDRLVAGASIARRNNPFYDRDDDRRRVWVRGERKLINGLRSGATLGWQRASFLGATDRFMEAGADIVFDTRVDPFLARNAVYARGGWEHLRFADTEPAVAGSPPRSLNRIDLDARGYIGLLGQSILALRAQREDADGPVPAYLRPILGGMPNLRGFPVGVAVGDTLVSTSAELIVPITSPLSVGKVGVTAFADAATVYDAGERLSDQTLRQGYGGSVWLSAAFVRFSVAVAHGRGSSTRVHVGGNVTF
jgi:outer membrane protein assembly factor BamA